MQPPTANETGLRQRALKAKLGSLQVAGLLQKGRGACLHMACARRPTHAHLLQTTMLPAVCGALPSGRLPEMRIPVGGAPSVAASCCGGAMSGGKQCSSCGGGRGRRQGGGRVRHRMPF